VGTSIPTGSRIVGQDPNPQEVKGVFNSLLRFREAVERGDLGQIARAAELFDEDLDRLTASRASLGVSLQQIDDLNRNHEDRNNDLTQSESRLFDADIAATIADLNGRQIAYEASLKLLAGTNRLNLFDFI
jgi:flagellar hook-associated protein 3 FlgL